MAMELIASVSPSLSVSRTAAISTPRTTFTSNSRASRKSLLTLLPTSHSMYLINCSLAHKSLFLSSSHSIKHNRLAPKIQPLTTDVSATVTSDAEITWQIIVGALAGVTPFIVAGIEFGKRIMAQQKCTVCGGSGLFLKEKVYFRCPGCGGFLPWQSWKRFFTG